MRRGRAASTASACELRLRKPRHSDARRENAAGPGQLRELIGFAMLSRRSDVQSLEIRPAEGAHRRTHRGHWKLRERFSAGRKTHDFASAVKGDPVAAFAIDSRAVRTIGLAAELGEDAPVG